VQIGDSGPGIPADERERVFDRFYRDSSARARADVSGSGLGLAIVKRVAAQQGATVTLGDAAAGGLLVSVVFRDAEMPAQAPQVSESV